MFIVWCEYDLGQEYVGFSTESAAIRWINRNLIEQNILEEDGEYTTFEILKSEGLAGVRSVTVVHE